ncbi:MAG: 16S rRNA (cytosine(1402)-N(4))-methyltransferase RsmH [Elusimicrobia bacterium]|nr:16S rRNA (cytosine(1402)-N(4))-methyltransferase RsmH [Elusimicrobiota bacterium]
MEKPAYEHQPVLLDEVLRFLVTEPAGFYLDATLGLGGHAEAILRTISAQGQLLGLDMDPEALHAAGHRLQAHPGQFRAVRANFRTLGQVLESEKFFPLAGALFDLGVSSMHFEKPERGFSFEREGPLDMRLAPDNPLTAGMIVNNWPAEQMALLFKEFGEEPAAGRIARALAQRRLEKLFSTTTELADFIASLLPRGRTHPATRVFMALRIAVNAELENLTRGLESVLPYLRRGGRLAVISFHSLEDRIVKNIFSSFVEQGSCRYVEEAGGKSPLTPAAAELVRNPRARSAKLRIVEKLS